jgi:tRNA modification GTPase
MGGTIAAISTAVGNAGISILRMSGDDAFAVADRVFRGRRPVSEQESHTVQYGRIVSEGGDTVDEVLLVKMESPRSYTRENVVEIHCHGGYLTAGRILGLLIANGAKPAEAGEFTKRAFLNGRIDLSQAEAVMDIIQARTRKGSKAALRQLEGELSSRIGTISSLILDVLARLEVHLDYPEYDDEDVTAADAAEAGEKALAELEALIKSFHYGKILREGMNVAIIGKPNVGKSSLMNLLSRANKSIVTDIPGTTRDVIEETVNIGGVPINLADTAGVRETSDIIETIGVERSIDVLRKSDYAILMFDASNPERDEDRRLYDLVRNNTDNFLVVFNKADLVADKEILEELTGKYPGSVAISVKGNMGIKALEERLLEFARENTVDADNQVLVTNARHEHQLKLAANALRTAIDAVKKGLTLDVVALDLKIALEELCRITGRTAGEDVIDAIFSRFCIGK